VLNSPFPGFGFIFKALEDFCKYLVYQESSDNKFYQIQSERTRFIKLLPVYRFGFLSPVLSGQLQDCLL